MNKQKLVLVVAILGFGTATMAATESPSTTNIDLLREAQMDFGWWVGAKTVLGVEEGHPPQYAEHEEDEVGLIIHTVGDITKPVIYSFYVIPDLHVGDVGAYPDYNHDGWRPDLDTTRVPDNMGGLDGSWPGRNANRIINLINDDYDFGSGNGRFCVVIGDISVRGEVAEQQHAKIKLDSLDCPWVPVIGNRDTYPYCGQWT